MYCKNCGNKLRKNSRFCAKCGKQVEKEEEKEQEIVEATFEEKEESKKEKEKKEEKQNNTSEEQKKHTMYCRHCGKEIAEDSRICPNCGYNLLKKASSGDPFTNFLICVVSFLLPVIGFILWLVMKSENNSKAKNALIAACIGVFTGFLLIFLVILFVIIALIA